MDLYRSITTRRKHAETPFSPDQIGRAASQRAGRPIPRAQISSPVALLSTSNILLNNAQHIAGKAHVEVRKTSTDNSVTSASDEESDGSSRSRRSRDTITDASSFDNSPSSPEPEPNHLSCYFKPAVDTRTKTLSRSPSMSSVPTMEAPQIPKRVPSHSKRAHETIHRKRSVQRMMSPPASRDLSRSSVEIFGAQSAPIAEETKESPFGQELAQLDEVAEEFGHAVRDAESLQDATIMRQLSLAQFCASDYMNEISTLLDQAFGKESPASSWF